MTDVGTYTDEALETAKKILATPAAADNEKVAAIEEIGEYSASIALPLLIQALAVGPDTIREAAATAIRRFGSEGAPAVQILVQQLRTIKRPGTLSESLTYALSNTTRGTGLYTAVFRELHDHRDPKVRWEAVHSLTEAVAIGEAWAISMALKATRDRDSSVRNLAASVLARAPSPTPEIIKALVKLLKDRDKYVPPEAAKALAAYGEPARPALPALLKAAAKKKGVAAQAAKLCHKLGIAEEKWLDLVLTELEQLTGFFKYRSVLISKFFADYPAEIKVRLFLKALGSKDAGTRFAAASGLFQLQQHQEKAFQVLLNDYERLESLDSSDAPDEVIQMFASMGPAAREALPFLRRIPEMDTTTRQRRKLALQAIRVIEAEAESQ